MIRFRFPLYYKDVDLFSFDITFADNVGSVWIAVILVNPWAHDCYPILKFNFAVP